MGCAKTGCVCAASDNYKTFKPGIFNHSCKIRNLNAFGGSSSELLVVQKLNDYLELVINYSSLPFIHFKGMQAFISKFAQILETFTVMSVGIRIRRGATHPIER